MSARGSLIDGAAMTTAPFTVHGGRLALARAQFPTHLEWIDLSTGISPWAYPAAVDAEALHRLPEPGALTALEAAAAAVFGSDPAATVAVPGSDIALRLIGRLIPARTPAILGPGYAGHQAMWPDAVLLTDLAAEQHDVLVLARPNNPDGAIIDRERLADAARLLGTKGGWLIVDEAFADAGTEPGIAAAKWPRTIVLRSFGKFFGLAGLRLGFVIAPPVFAASLRQMLGDWPISGPAIAIGTAAYRDLAWQTAQRRRLSDAAVRLDEVLSEAGFAIAGGTPCFRLVDTPNAAGVFEQLARSAILTRPFADDPRRLRVGLPSTETDTARLKQALQTARMT